MHFDHVHTFSFSVPINPSYLVSLPSLGPPFLYLYIKHFEHIPPVTFLQLFRNFSKYVTFKTSYLCNFSRVKKCLDLILNCSLQCSQYISILILYLLNNFDNPQTPICAAHMNIGGIIY